VGALLVEAVTVAATLGDYHLGGRDTDAGALVGSRPDERQHGIALRASAQAAHAMVLAALAGFVFETASGGDPWPFAFLIAVGGASFVAGLACSHGA